MNKILLVVYSKDRAAQLDLLIRSINVNAEGIFDIGIVWTSSNDDYKQGYNLLKEKYSSIKWCEQHNNLLSLATRKIVVDLAPNGVYTHIAFSTDDNVFFRFVPSLENCLPFNQGEVFSFRLGFNTIEQDIHKGTKQPPLNLYYGRGEWIAWNPNYYHPYHNYGYPLAVDLHVFHKDLAEQIMDTRYKTSNELETLMQNFRFKVNSLKSFKHSVAVNIPNNNLSGITAINQDNFISPAELNQRFLNGERIRLFPEDVEIRGCHQNLKFEFGV